MTALKWCVKIPFTDEPHSLLTQLLCYLSVAQNALYLISALSLTESVEHIWIHTRPDVELAPVLKQWFLLFYFFFLSFFLLSSLNEQQNRIFHPFVFMWTSQALHCQSAQLAPKAEAKMFSNSNIFFTGQKLISITLLLLYIELKCLPVVWNQYWQKHFKIRVTSRGTKTYSGVEFSKEDCSNLLSDLLALRASFSAVRILSVAVFLSSSCCLWVGLQFMLDFINKKEIECTCDEKTDPLMLKEVMRSLNCECTDIETGRVEITALTSSSTVLWQRHTEGKLSRFISLPAMNDCLRKKEKKKKLTKAMRHPESFNCLYLWFWMKEQIMTAIIVTWCVG